MKSSLFYALGVLSIVAFLSSCAGTKVTDTWMEPGYIGSQPAKIIVVAKITEPENRRLFENTTVNYLTKKGYTAVASYKVITEADAQSEAKFVAKLKSEGIDSLILYKVLREKTDYKENPEISTGAGIPVNLGIFQFYIGGNIPLFGGGSKAIPRADVEARFYQDDAEAAHWKGQYDLRLDKSINDTAEWVAETTVDKLIKSGALSK